MFPCNLSKSFIYRFMANSISLFLLLPLNAAVYLIFCCKELGIRSVYLGKLLIYPSLCEILQELNENYLKMTSLVRHIALFFDIKHQMWFGDIFTITAENLYIIL